MIVTSSMRMSGITRQPRRCTRSGLSPADSATWLTSWRDSLLPHALFSNRPILLTFVSSSTPGGRRCTKCTVDFPPARKPPHDVNGSESISVPRSSSNSKERQGRRSDRHTQISATFSERWTRDAWRQARSTKQYPAASTEPSPGRGPHLQGGSTCARASSVRRLSYRSVLEDVMGLVDYNRTPPHIKFSNLIYKMT